MPIGTTPDANAVVTCKVAGATPDQVSIQDIANFVHADSLGVMNASADTVPARIVFTAIEDPVDGVIATATLNPSGGNNAILFTAVPGGEAGNAITVTYAMPEDEDEATTLQASVDGTDIVFTLAVGSNGSTVTTTASALIAAINAGVGAFAAVKRLVTPTLPSDGGANDGSGLLAAVSETSLSGGVDGDGQGVAGFGSLAVSAVGGRIYHNTGTARQPVWVLTRATADE